MALRVLTLPEDTGSKDDGPQSTGSHSAGAQSTRSQPNVKQQQRIPAVASLAIRDVIDGPSVPGRVLGTSRFAVWIAVADSATGAPADRDGDSGACIGACIVVGTSDAVRLPNSLAIAVTAATRPFAGIKARDVVRVGDGALLFDDLRVDQVRWWNPRPSLSPTTIASLSVSSRRLSRRLETADDPLGVALAAGDVGAATSIITGRLGGGDGLTPYEDDVICGALAAQLLLGEALAGATASRSRTFVHNVGDAVCPIAWQRTTTLSAALLRHAANGEVATPVGHLLQALTAHGDVASATNDLLRVGHSSGIGLTKGVLIGARAALALERAS